MSVYSNDENVDAMFVDNVEIPGPPAVVIMYSVSDKYPLYDDMLYSYVVDSEPHSIVLYNGIFVSKLLKYDVRYVDMVETDGP